LEVQNEKKEQENAIKLRGEGMSIPDIAKYLNISKG